MGDKTKHLIAVGTAAVNCRPCLGYHVPQCIKAGASEDVRNTIETGFKMNRGAHTKKQSYVEDVIADAKHDND